MNRPFTSARLLFLPFVIAFHVVGIFVLAGQTGRVSQPPAQSAASVVILIQPKIRDNGDTTAEGDLSRLTALREMPLQSLMLDQPEINLSVSRNEAASRTAPLLDSDGRGTIGPYLKQAALRPGEGATVVLRVEVLESGKPGDIQLDSSSGSPQVDQAAIDYARTQHWYAGRVNNVPQRMWIRWGIRLQA